MVFILAAVFFLDIGNDKQLIGPLVGYHFGLYYVYTYAFNLTMYTPGWIFTPSRNTICRFLIFACGVSLMISVLSGYMK